jgi:hypothetical protein
MPNRNFGWLFGLEGDPSETLTSDILVLRQMSTVEQGTILNAAQDFFARDIKFWQQMISRFPFVYEKVAADNHPLGGDSAVAMVLSLLSPGEVRSPIQWLQQPTARSSSSEVVDYFFRFMNGRFKPVKFQEIRDTAIPAFEKLEASPWPTFYADNFFLIDRLYSSKRHVLNQNGDGAEVLARASDICIGLEHIFNEGASELQFRLAISLAWTLETEPLRREEVINHTRNTYKLRSKMVHGAKRSAEDLKPAQRESVVATDCLFRRAMLARIISGLDHDDWIHMIRGLRVGYERPDLDRIPWLKI